MQYYRLPILVLFVWQFLTGNNVKANQGDLLFMYSDHEPYVIATETGLSGFLVDYINQVATDASITPHWNNVPWEKQLPTLKRNPENVCAVTLFKTPEREVYLRFTAAVGSNGSFVLVSVKNNQSLLDHTSFSDVIEDPALSPVLQSQTVYNAYIDDLLAGKDFPKIDGSIQRIARSLVSGTHDYFILANVRAKAFFERRNFSDKLAVYDHYSDLTEETFYYIGCSLSTDDAVFKRLNDAIVGRGLAIPR